ncbi:MAG: 3-isopropylmalate dehydratase [Candidatus Heimdallarchaeota archaeon]
MVDLSNLSGKAMMFGDYMNTDIIIASHFLEDSDPNIYCKKVMYPVRPTAWQEIQDQGDTVFVGGIDFGSGSSREQAPDAIKYAGVKVVVAESFATIFFRNCINVGLPLLEVPRITKEVEEGVEISINLETGEVTVLSNGKKLQGNKLEPFLLNKLQMGGLIPELQKYVKQNNLV